jgi:hypothetical protein
MSQWVRLWEDMPTDPKWRVVARRAGRPLAEVLAVFVFMLTNASKAQERGTLANWNDEDVGAAIDVDAEHVAAIRDAMQGKTLDGDKLTGWERRQPKREDGAAERAKEWRKSNRTQPNATERPKTPREDTDTDTEKKETAAAVSLAAAAEKSEIEEIANALEDATGWRLPGVPMIRDLVSAGNSLMDRVVPLAKESAASWRRLNKGKPESWAYLATIVRDNYREPAPASKAAKAAQELVKVPQSSEAWPRAADRYRAERGKPPPVVDGVSWFPPHMLAPARTEAAA